MPSFDHIQQEIAAMLAVPEEELTEEQRTTLNFYLDELGTQEAAKIDSFAQFLRIEADHAAAIKAESDRLARRAKTTTERLNWLKMHYLGIMQGAGLRKIAGNVYTASVRESKIVAVQNAAEVPDEFWREKVERSVDKIAVKNALAEGTIVPGCALVPSYSLQVR